MVYLCNVIVIVRGLQAHIAVIPVCLAVPQCPVRRVLRYVNIDTVCNQINLYTHNELCIVLYGSTDTYLLYINLLIQSHKLVYSRGGLFKCCIMY